jgi:hypothetical protein
VILIIFLFPADIVRGQALNAIGGKPRPGSFNITVR